jgi:hypothetical protein
VNPVQLWPAPHYHPFACIRCGLGNGQREYFIDLGLNLSGYFNPMNEGSIYYCNECVSNLIGDINREVAKWHHDHSPWDSPDRVEASYSWQEQIDVSGIEQEIESRGTPVTSNSGDEGNDFDAEQDDPVLAESVELSEPAVLTDDAEHARPKRSLDFTFGTQ